MTDLTEIEVLKYKVEDKVDNKESQFFTVCIDLNLSDAEKEIYGCDGSIKIWFCYVDEDIYRWEIKNTYFSKVLGARLAEFMRKMQLEARFWDPHVAAEIADILEESYEICVFAALPGIDVNTGVDRILAGKIKSEKINFAKYNKIIAMFEFLAAEARDLPNKCIICRKELEYPGALPTICFDQACSYSYEELGVGISLETQICSEPEKFIMLIEFLHAAIKDSRIHLFPVPEHIMISRIADVISYLPGIEILQKWSVDGELRKNLKSIHPRLPNLLIWLLTSLQAYFKYLPGKLGDDAIVFRMISDSREKEIEFQCRKLIHGSSYTYHGSWAGNWHAIIRTGLKNMSGTKNMLNGAVHGPGIYMNDSVSFISGYSSPSKYILENLYGRNWRCIAICELINDPKRKKKYHHVEPDEMNVCVRYLVLSFEVLKEIPKDFFED